MRLRDRNVEAVGEDRAELAERATVGATPGQKLIGGVTSVLAVAAIFGGIGYKFWYLPSHQPASAPSQAQQKADQSAPTSPSLHLNTFTPAPTSTPEPTGGNPPLPPGMAGAAPTGGQKQGGQAGANPQAVSQQQQNEEQARKAILDRKLRSDMGAMPGRSDSAMLPVAANQPVQPNAAPASMSLPIGGGQGTNDFSAKLIPTSTPKVAATYIPNPSFTVAKGTPIRCTLDTAMNSDTPGFVSCTVSKPVYGMDGKVVLIDRGSTVDGELPKGPDRGKKRAAVLWGRIVTPFNIAIQVNSPGTDTLGAAGLTGSIDNHYCERFCGAFLFSSLEDVLQGGVQALGNKSSSGNTNIVLPQNTMNSGQSAAGEILTQGRDVQPTFSKNQGDEISITVARDLDFTTAYHLEPVQQ